MKHPAVKTPIDIRELAKVVRADWPEATTEAVWLLVAHSAFETGWWKSCWNWNLGNAKAGESENHCYFECGENLNVDYANKLVAEDPARCKILRVDGKTAAMTFFPDHPMCRFKSFDSLGAAVASHLKMLREKFPRSWSVLATGKPVEYAKTLKAEAYYTGPLDTYVTGVEGCYMMVATKLKAQREGDKVIDLSFRKLVVGESKPDRMIRIAKHMASCSAADMRALLEPGAQDAKWTCMVRARAIVWHACCLPEDGMGKIIVIEFTDANGKKARQTFGKYGDDEDRTIFNCILYPSNHFVWARPGLGNKLVLEKAAIGWQSAPAGGNDHVVFICGHDELGVGQKVKVFTVEGGQVGPDTQQFTRTWMQRADGRLDNVGEHGSPTPGSSIVQGLAYCDKWPILIAPEEEEITDPSPSGKLPPEAPTKPDTPYAIPSPVPDPFPDVSRETVDEHKTEVPTVETSSPTPTFLAKRTPLQFVLLAVFGVGASIIGWLLHRC